MTGRRDRFLPFAPPSIGEAEIAEVVDTLRSGWITTGPKTKRLEAAFAEFVGAPGALALNSCTGAMHTGLAALGVGPGHAVVTTTMTFCSTVACIELLGATPLLVDVEPDTLNIDPGLAAAAVRQHRPGRGRAGEVRGLMPVHLYGHPCDMEPLQDLAAREGLFILEDAAHALPACYHGRRIGTIGTLTAFSFYATKNMTTGEGGMLAGDPGLLEQAAVWSLHGMDRDAWKRYEESGSWYYEVVSPGFKYNMTDIQAALGLHQLRRLPDFHRRRREIAARYTAALQPLDEVEVPAERPGVDHAWHIYPLRLRLERLAIDRAAFIRAMHEERIGCSVHFIPVHLHPFYRNKYGFKPDDFPVAFAEYQRLVSLPIYPGMTDGDVEDVIDAVARIVKAHAKRSVR